MLASNWFIAQIVLSVVSVPVLLQTVIRDLKNCRLHLTSITAFSVIEASLFGNLIAGMVMYRKVSACIVD